MPRNVPCPAPQLVAYGHCTVATPTNAPAQNAFGAAFLHSGVGFWEIDFANTNPDLDTSKVLVTVSFAGNGPGVSGCTYGVALAAGPLYAISTFDDNTKVQTNYAMDVKFELMPSIR